MEQGNRSQDCVFSGKFEHKHTPHPPLQKKNKKAEIEKLRKGPRKTYCRKSENKDYVVLHFSTP